MIEKNRVYVRYEVLAEVVYVLNKVYSLPRSVLAEGINAFLSNPNVDIESEEAVHLILKTYSETTNMDFVDSILYGLSAIYGHSVFTFDKLLNSMISKLN